MLSCLVLSCLVLPCQYFVFEIGSKELKGQFTEKLTLALNFALGQTCRSSYKLSEIF